MRKRRRSRLPGNTPRIFDDHRIRVRFTSCGRPRRLSPVLPSPEDTFPSLRRRVCPMVRGRRDGVRTGVGGWRVMCHRLRRGAARPRIGRWASCIERSHLVVGHRTAHAQVPNGSRVRPHPVGNSSPAANAGHRDTHARVPRCPTASSVHVAHGHCGIRAGHARVCAWVPGHARVRMQAWINE